MSREGDHVVSKSIDREFVWELCKRGHVNVLSTQVNIRGPQIDLSGLKIPEGCEIEYVSARPVDEHHAEVSITFGWPKAE